MPSTSLFFPKRLQGTALGIQAGIGNFGVSVAQFMTPVMLGIATYGAAETFTKTDPKTKEVLGTQEIYVQKCCILVCSFAYYHWDFGLADDPKYSGKSIY